MIGLIIIGRDPFALFGMQAPGMWEWGQGNKVRFPGIKTVSLWERFYCSVFMCNSVLDGRLGFSVDGAAHCFGKLLQIAQAWVACRNGERWALVSVYLQAAKYN